MLVVFAPIGIAVGFEFVAVHTVKVPAISLDFGTFLVHLFVGLAVQNEVDYYASQQARKYCNYNEGDEHTNDTYKSPEAIAEEI